MREERLIVEIELCRSSEQKLWSALLAMLAEAKDERLKDSAENLQGVNYSRLLRIRGGAALTPEEVASIKIYFQDQLRYLEFSGSLSRVELARKEDGQSGLSA